MKRRRPVAFFTAFALVLAGWQFADLFLVAKAALPPQATRFQIARSIFQPPYSMASPHRSLLRALGERMSLIGVADLCAQDMPIQYCNGLEVKGDANCPYCPNGCFNQSGCFVRECVYTGNNHTYCNLHFNTPPCANCRDDQNQGCKPF